MYLRKSERWVKHIDFMIVDLIALHLAFILAYWIRNGSPNPYGNQIYLNIAVILTFLDVLVSIFFESFKNVTKRGYYNEFSMLVKHVFLVVLSLSFYLFSVQAGADYSRTVVYLTGIFYVIFGYLFRICWKRYLQKRRYEKGKRSLLILTTRERAEASVNDIRQNNYEQYEIEGLALADETKSDGTIAGVKIAAGMDNVLEYASRKWIDEVLIDLPKEIPYPAELTDRFHEMGIVVHTRLSDSFQKDGRKCLTERMGGHTVLTTSINIISLRQSLLKRSLDILGGICGCAATLLLLLFLGPAIYLQSPGPIFFSQVRIGKNGKRFRMYKFRSMYLDAEERKKELMEKNRVSDGLMFKMDWDPRIIGSRELPDGTRKKGIGNFIREWSLDEFPQFFNVLKGDMSLVGTRPPTVDEWEKYELHHRARLAMKPGITGLWQVSGRSQITDFEEVVKLDLKYINSWSMGLDFRILLKTAGIVFKKEGSL